VFLGLKLWFKDSRFEHSVPTGEKPDRYKSLLAGFSITLGNPKAILFHMGFLPTFFDLTVISVWDAFLIVLIFMTMLGSSFMIYAYAASKARLLFRDQRRFRILNRCAGTILIGAGVAVATKK
jgi:threonine/homoserine/homoserine lactone efflux protein